jgi:AmpD protein
MAYRNFERPSPNCGAGRNERLGVLFHHSQTGFEETIARMGEPESQVSYHCLIDRDGTRCTLAEDTRVAWHAGASSFLGRSRCNDFLVGVSFAGDTYVEPLSGDQIESALDWLDARWDPLGWDPGRMTDHRQVSPGRKLDLNPPEWDRLIAAIGARFAGREARRSFTC